MPRRCCVPNCKGNYNSTLKDNNSISIFLFPKDEELRKKWIAAIPRKNWTPTKYSALCSLHFAETDVERYQVSVSPAGVLENVLLRCPRLIPNSVPSIFPNSLSHLIKHVLPQRKEPADRQESTGFFRKEVMKPELNSTKCKVESPHNKHLEKIQKTGQGGESANALIRQRSKYMAIQTPQPISQPIKVQESPIMEEIKRQYVVEERKITKLQKKFEAVQKTISSLSASHNAELRAKEEILQQLNGDWESSTKYYYEISESLKEFQHHKDNLSKLYNNVIVAQQSTIKKLQQELSTMGLKDKEHKNVSEIESKAAEHEKRLQEMMIMEIKLKKHLDEVKKKSILEKDQLHNIHAEEKLELMKKQEKLASMNKDLTVQLEKLVQEKQNLSTLFVEKDRKISKLQEEINMCRYKVENLLHRNTELSLRYKETVKKEKELRTQLESKLQEV